MTHQNEFSRESSVNRIKLVNDPHFSENRLNTRAYEINPSKSPENMLQVRRRFLSPESSVGNMEVKSILHQSRSIEPVS